jgi:hypothetical protein
MIKTLSGDSKPEAYRNLGMCFMKKKKKVPGEAVKPIECPATAIRMRETRPQFCIGQKKKMLKEKEIMGRQDRIKTK